jgi:hypothetical protein
VVLLIWFIYSRINHQGHSTQSIPSTLVQTFNGFYSKLEFVFLVSFLHWIYSFIKHQKLSSNFFYFHVTVDRNKFLISQIYFGMKPYMCRTVRLSNIWNFFTVHSAMVYVIQVCWELSIRTTMEQISIVVLIESCMTYTIAECTVNKLLMMDRRTVRNM